MCARPTPVPESLPSPVGASPRLVPVACSPSGRYQTASAVVSDVSSSAVASTPLRLRLVPQPPRASTARPGSPRARTAALDRVATPPREDGPALPGRRVHSRRSLPCRFFLCRVALLCLVLRRRRRLPVPCSRGFFRLSAQLRPPCCISWPLESIELSSSKDESSDAHCDHAVGETYDRSEYVHTLSGGQLIRDTKTYQNVRPVDQIRGR